MLAFTDSNTVEQMLLGALTRPASSQPRRVGG
jgi:hypothetical protein